MRYVLGVGGAHSSGKSDILNKYEKNKGFMHTIFFYYFYLISLFTTQEHGFSNKHYQEGIWVKLIQHPKDPKSRILLLDSAIVHGTFFLLYIKKFLTVYSSTFYKCGIRLYSKNWGSWEVYKLDFFFEKLMIHYLIKHHRWFNVGGDRCNAGHSQHGRMRDTLHDTRNWKCL